MNELTKKQIDYLFQFTKEHRVRYLDLQSELVDHLASAIEEKWAKGENISFEEALKEVYADFGIFGFGKLENQKRTAIQKKINYRIIKYLKAYLTFPKVGLTLLLVVSLFMLLNQVTTPILFAKKIIFTIILCFGCFLYKVRLQNRAMEKNYLELQYIFTGGFPILAIPYFIIDFTSLQQQLNLTGLLVISCALTIVTTQVLWFCGVLVLWCTAYKTKLT